MARLPVSCDTLGDLDGGAARAIINRALREAVFDLDDRAAQDDKPRKVEIVVTFKARDNGDVDVHVEANSKTPRRRTATTTANVKRQDGAAQLVFSQFAPEDPRQSTLDEHEGRARE